MSECVNKCGNEAKGQSRYCSKSCKTLYNRRLRRIERDKRLMDESVTLDRNTDVTPAGNTAEDHSGVSPRTGQLEVQAVTITEQPAVKDLTRIELHQAIKAYPHDQWVNSPEHKELLRRIESMTAEQLENEGYYVPVGK